MFYVFVSQLHTNNRTYSRFGFVWRWVICPVMAKAYSQFDILLYFQMVSLIVTSLNSFVIDFNFLIQYPTLHLIKDIINLSESLFHYHLNSSWNISKPQAQLRFIYEFCPPNFLWKAIKIIYWQMTDKQTEIDIRLVLASQVYRM